MKRLYLSATEMREMLIAQHGLCATPGCGSEGPFEADHSNPSALAGGKPDQLLCVPCHRRKTFGLRGDISNIAKVRRIAEKRTQYDKRKENGPQIKGRGFQGWRGLDGSLRLSSTRKRT